MLFTYHKLHLIEAKSITLGTKKIHTIYVVSHYVVYSLTFMILLEDFTKVCTSILYIYSLFADEAKQQGSDTLELVNCQLPYVRSDVGNNIVL